MNYKYREKFSHYLQRSPFDQTEQSVSNFCIQLYPVIQIRLRRHIEIISQHSTDIPKRRCRSNRCCKWSRFSFKNCSLKISCGSLALLKPIVRPSFASVEITPNNNNITFARITRVRSRLGNATPLPSSKPHIFLARLRMVIRFRARMTMRRGL